MKTTITLLALFFMSTIMTVAQNNEDCACCSVNHQAFDFWIGNWTVYNTTGKVIGTNKIVKVQNGCVLQENWVAADSTNTGTSYNFYDSSDSTWNQVWISNTGNVLRLKGNRNKDGAMVLKSDLVKGSKGDYYNQINWTKNEDGSVTQVWDIFDKEGNRLRQLFKGIYKKEELLSKNKMESKLPEVVSGTIERIEMMQSKYVTARHVDVWLPEHYTPSKKYAVLYMHDGQMLFDPDKTWNKQAWNVDDVVSESLDTNQLKDFIVVGIWNGGQTRHTDYFPQQPFEQLSRAEKDTVTHQLQKAKKTEDQFHPQSDHYLQFIVEELKPIIDKTYSVYTDRANTFIAGSSMGGLISMYAICEYPEVFGGAACLSTHWVGTFTLQNNPVPKQFLRYLKKNLPNPKTHKIYFDTGDKTLDALYPDIQKKVDRLMRKKGYDTTSWMTQYYPGENHSEQAWNKRLHRPLSFLLKK